MKLTTIIASATTAAVLGTIGVSVAGATGGGGSTPKPAVTASATAAADNGGAKGVLRMNAKEGLAVAAKTIGISTKDLAAGIKGGKSIAQIATDNHKNPQDVINALVAAADKKIDANSKLSADQKAKLKAKAPDVVAKFVNSTHLRGATRAGVKAELRKRFAKEAATVAAKAIGITPKELATEVKSGKTVAQVATDHQKNPQDVISALVTAIDKRIDASPKLSADRKTSIKAKVPARVTNFVNNWHPKK
jgi:uncharacterized protein (DUF433 family)